MANRIVIAAFQIRNVRVDVLANHFETRKFDKILHENGEIQRITNWLRQIAIVFHRTPTLQFAPADHRARVVRLQALTCPLAVGLENSDDQKSVEIRRLSLPSENLDSSDIGCCSNRPILSRREILREEERKSSIGSVQRELRSIIYQNSVYVLDQCE